MATGEKNITVNITASTVAKIFFVGAIFVALWYVRDLVLVVLTAIVIASFVDLIIKKIPSGKLHRTVSVVLIYFVGGGLIFALFYFFIPVFYNQQFIDHMINSSCSYIFTARFRFIGQLGKEIIKTKRATVRTAARGHRDHIICNYSIFFP